MSDYVKGAMTVIITVVLMQLFSMAQRSAAVNQQIRLERHLLNDEPTAQPGEEKP